MKEIRKKILIAASVIFLSGILSAGQSSQSREKLRHIGIILLVCPRFRRHLLHPRMVSCRNARVDGDSRSDDPFRDADVLCDAGDLPAAVHAGVHIFKNPKLQERHLRTRVQT